MAEVQQDTSSQPTPDIASLTGAGDKSAISDLVTMQKARTAEDFSIMRAADKQLSSDQARVEKAYTAEGVGHDELKPWDANKEHAKFEHDPIEGFGSVGGLFAMVASAFTKTPMDNAINGMAGALNSIKAGDEAAYERAYGSWKDNTKLALDRHKVQHDLYSDALGLMSANQGAAQAKLHNAAVRFGDSQMLTLAEHGMVKELFELQESRARAASQMMEMMDKTTENVLRNKAYQAGLNDIPDTGNPAVDAAHRLALFTRTHKLQKETPQQSLMGQFFLENPKATAEEAATFADKHGLIQKYRTSESTTENRLVASEIKRRAASLIADGAEPSAAFDQAMIEVKAVKSGDGSYMQPQNANASSSGNNFDGLVTPASMTPVANSSSSSNTFRPHKKAASMSALTAQEIQNRADDKIAQGMDPHAAFDEAMREVKAASTAPGRARPLSNSALKAQEVRQRTEIYEKENLDKGMPPEKAHIEAFNRAEHEVAASSVVPSGNRVDDLRSKIDQTDNIILGSEKNMDFLRQYKGGAGLMGKIMRGEEIASNIIGAGTQSDRVEFRRRVHELQEMVPRIITDQNGRPLKAAQDKVDDFVAGLNAGDTSANTIRAYEDLISQMKKRQQDYRGRVEGAYDSETRSSGAKPGAEGKKPDADWLNAYPVKK